MSNFYCEKCGALCEDTPRGYKSGCEHYPPDLKPIRGFGMTMENGIARKWYVDQYGQQRWVDNDAPCLTKNLQSNLTKTTTTNENKL